MAAGGVSTAVTQYAWDARYVDAPICRFRTPAGGTTEILYYTTDANNNVTGLVDGTPNNLDGTAGSATAGQVVERYVYDAYGNVTFLKGNAAGSGDWTPQHVAGQDANTDGTLSAYDNEVLYCGYRYDPETGNFHVRNRAYCPTLGVWLQRDPVLAGLNPYEYCTSAPVVFVDPLGLQTRTGTVDAR